VDFSKHFEPMFFFLFLFYVLTSDAGPHMIQSLGISQRKALLGTSVPTETSANCTCTRARIGAMGVRPRSYLERKTSDTSLADTVTIQKSHSPRPLIDSGIQIISTTQSASTDPTLLRSFASVRSIPPSVRELRSLSTSLSSSSCLYSPQAELRQLLSVQGCACPTSPGALWFLWLEAQSVERV
jgi:hypothetical protein